MVERKDVLAEGRAAYSQLRALVKHSERVGRLLKQAKQTCCRLWSDAQMA